MGLIGRVLANRLVDFDGSKIYYWDVPMVAIPFEVFSKNQYKLQSNLGPDIKKIYYSLGKIQGKNGSNILLKKYKITPNKNDFTFYIEQSKFVGIGRIELLELDLENLIFRVIIEDTPHCKFIKEKEGTLNTSFCDYQRGLIVGSIESIMTILLNKEVNLDGIEIKCLAKGDEVCEFLIKESSEFDEKEPLELKNPCIEFVKKKETINTLLRKSGLPKSKSGTTYHKTLKNNKQKVPFKYDGEGYISFLGERVLITPMDIFILLYYIIKECYGEEADNLFYEFGKEMAFLTYPLLSNYFSFHSKTNNLNILFEQTGLFGFGIPYIVNSNISKGVIIVNLNDSPGKHYKELISQSNLRVDYFICGYLSGITEKFTKMETFTEETNCIVEGSPKCIFKITYKQ